MFEGPFLYTSFIHTQEMNAERVLCWQGWHLARELEETSEKTF